MSQSPSEDDHRTKRQRKDDNADESKDQLAEDPTQENEKGEKDTGEPNCVVCMEEGNSVNPLLPSHQCPQCAPGAWSVCTVCNEALLSRLCPVCRADYAPITMYRMPGLPFKRLADSSLSQDEKSSLLYKFGIVRQMVGRSNVAVWSQKNHKMYFSLPEKLVDASEGATFIITAVTVPDADVGEEIFYFSNKVWDLIENEVEHGASQAGESVDYSHAVQHILNVTKEDNHRLFTMLSPADWDYMLNPETSGDVHDTIRAIKLNILHKVESVIPSTDSR